MVVDGEFSDAAFEECKEEEGKEAPAPSSVSRQQHSDKSVT
jgi:hypothetical protein